MKLTINGNRLYCDNLMFSHVEIRNGNGNKPFSGEAEPRYSHHAGRELLHIDGLGWMGADASCSIRVGRVVRSDGEVMPCVVTEARLLGMANYSTEQGKRITLEIEHG